LLVILGAVAAVVLVGGLLNWMFIASRFVSTEDAYIGASTARISAQVSGIIAEVPAAETRHVKAGDVLVVIDPADAKLAQERAQADYQRTLQHVRQYYAQASVAAAEVAARQSEFTRASTDFDRRQALAATGAVSGEELSAARGQRDAALANLNAAKSTLAVQNALIAGTKVENNPETLAAKAALDKANLDLSRTKILAPIDGVIVQNAAQVGQRVDSGTPLMSITPIADAYVDANFKEGQLRKVKVGQPVELKSDVYGGGVKYHGKVVGIGGGTGSSMALIPAQNATGNWIKVVQRLPVRIELDPKELHDHPLRVGLSTEATIDLAD
jgi:membrane fusion protein (multidrug efflux system)